MPLFTIEVHIQVVDDLAKKKENEQNYRIEKDIFFPFTNETFCECHTIVNIKDLV